ncbi:MAG: folate-binding protein [Pseudomonadota bacterium]
MTSYFAQLPDRTIVTVSGEDSVEFLQGLVTNDITRASTEEAVFSALLTPQGKFLFDFFVVSEGDKLLLDVAAEGAEDLIKRLMRFRLRAKVQLEKSDEDMSVWAIWGDRPEVPAGVGNTFSDPRHDGLGWRLVTTANPESALIEAGLVASDADAYDAMRLDLAIPDGAKDLKVESSALLESNYDALNAISWDKGCYMGQELTARTRYRGLVKRRLVSIEFDGDRLAPETPVTRDGRTVGEVRSSRGGRGLASLRLDALEPDQQAQLMAGDAVLQARLPDYLIAQ